MVIVAMAIIVSRAMGHEQEAVVRHTFGCRRTQHLQSRSTSLALLVEAALARQHAFHHTSAVISVVVLYTWTK